MTTAAAKTNKARQTCPSDFQYCHDHFENLFRSNFFKCLNDETRQEIILVISQDGNQGMRVSDIATHFDLDRTTISHHLTMLRDNNLLMLTKRGKERYYSVNTDYVIGTLESTVDILKACCK
ncbi:winged helix-turn-helix transcriptional regulator [Candidatus Poribacteria bacterium]|nr:winged helix-turn-helix transcriptional regulator [Candidatus Poribacteria bacterium]